MDIVTRTIELKDWNVSFDINYIPGLESIYSVVRFEQEYEGQKFEDVGEDAAEVANLLLGYHLIDKIVREELEGVAA